MARKAVAEAEAEVGAVDSVMEATGWVEPEEAEAEAVAVVPEAQAAREAEGLFPYFFSIMVREEM